MFPFICRAIRRHKYSPNPLPRVNVFSLVKRWNTYSCLSAEMPQPVSVTLIIIFLFSLLQLQDKQMLPSWVNLFALFSKERNNNERYCAWVWAMHSFTGRSSKYCMPSFPSVSCRYSISVRQIEVTSISSRGSASVRLSRLATSIRLSSSEVSIRVFSCMMF